MTNNIYSRLDFVSKSFSAAMVSNKLMLASRPINDLKLIVSAKQTITVIPKMTHRFGKRQLFLEAIPRYVIKLAQTIRTQPGRFKACVMIISEMLAMSQYNCFCVSKLLLGMLMALMPINLMLARNASHLDLVGAFVEGALYQS